MIFVILVLDQNMRMMNIRRVKEHLKEENESLKQLIV
jgi:hypothetical protein